MLSRLKIREDLEFFISGIANRQLTDVFDPVNRDGLDSLCDGGVP